MKENNILIELLHNKGVFIDKTLNNKLSAKDFKTLFFAMIIFFAASVPTFSRAPAASAFLFPPLGFPLFLKGGQGD